MAEKHMRYDPPINYDSGSDSELNNDKGQSCSPPSSSALDHIFIYNNLQARAGGPMMDGAENTQEGGVAGDGARDKVKGAEGGESDNSEGICADCDERFEREDIINAESCFTCKEGETLFSLKKSAEFPWEKQHQFCGDCLTKGVDEGHCPVHTTNMKQQNEDWWTSTVKKTQWYKEYKKKNGS